AERRSSRRTSEFSRTSETRSSCRSLTARVAKPSPKARAMASPNPESCVRKLTRISGLSKASLLAKRESASESKGRDGKAVFRLGPDLESWDFDGQATFSLLAGHDGEFQRGQGRNTALVEQQGAYQRPVA